MGTLKLMQRKKADVEEKSVELVGKKRESIKISGDEKKFEESEEGKQWKEEQKRKISELLEKDVEEEYTPELFSVEELFGKRQRMGGVTYEMSILWEGVCKK